MIQDITSAQNQQFKWLKRMMQKKYRDSERVMLLEGARIVNHGVQLGHLPKAIFLRYGLDHENVEAYLHLGCPVFVLAEALFEQVSDTVHSQGILGVFSRDMECALSIMGPHVVILDQIQDPGNLGTIIRTCDALGLTEIYMTKGTTDPYSQKVLRATMGSIFNVKLHTHVSMDVLQGLKDKGFALVSTALEDSISLSRLTAFAEQGAIAICFGNEGNGVSQTVLAMSDYRVKIPMRGGAESLNVAVAAAIALYQIQAKYLE